MKYTPHALQRANERFMLDRSALADIAVLIETGRAQYVCPETLDRALYKVVYDRRQVHVVYDKARRQVVTVLDARLPSAYLGRLRQRERTITTKPEVPFDVPDEWWNS